MSMFNELMINYSGSVYFLNTEEIYHFASLCPVIGSGHGEEEAKA